MLRHSETRRNEATLVTSVKEISCATVKTCPDCCEWLLFCQDKFQSDAVLHRCHLGTKKRSLKKTKKKHLYNVDEIAR